MAKRVVQLIMNIVNTSYQMKRITFFIVVLFITVIAKSQGSEAYWLKHIGGSEELAAWCSSR